MDAVAQLGRVVLSLAVVLLLMWALARFVRRPGRSDNLKLMDVLSREQLSRNSSIAVVRVLDQALIVGVTDGHVSLIGEVDLAAAEEQLEQALAPKKRRRPAAVDADDADAPVAPAAPTARTAPSAPNAPRVTIPADIPGADLLNKNSRVTKQGRIGTSKTAQDAKSSPLSGSALSPGTWRQTVESLRDLTVRSR